MATIYKLIIEDDEGKTTVYPLSAGEISIGRKEGNTIRLMERNVSRRHARLLRNNGSVFIEDLDSYNGIRINGERINGRYEVKEGDLVEIGDYHLALQAAEIEDDIAHPSKSDPGGQRSEWPAVGTVPDFRLPEEIIAGIRKEGAPRIAAAGRDTLVDQPPPTIAPPPAVMPVATKTPPIQFANAPTPESLPGRDPFVSPPPRPEDPGQRSLPPFPGPGSLTPPPPAAQARKEGVQADDNRTTLKPGAPKKEAPDAALTSPIAVGPQRTASVPRLVCVSTTYAGKEFALTRPELIIGRVEDNDIVIEHRSVSRNHAKIVFDGRVHKIIDLQSANGILVNGEEYAMTDLRKSDLIELGHVKFRFVPAGEAFAPTDEELREMREAGVQPAPEPIRPTDATHQLSAVSAPSAGAPPQKSSSTSQAKTVEMVSEMPGPFDPSTAATVTDTPLSALALTPSATPQIDPMPSGPPSLPPALKRSEGPREDRGRAERPDRSDTAAPRASADQRATEINVPPSQGRANGTSQALGASPSPSPKPVSEPTRPRMTNIEPPLRAPKSSGTNVILIIGAVIIVGVLAVLLITMRGPDGSEDRQLEELVKKGAYQEAIDFYKKHKFKDDAHATKLLQEAATHLEQPKPDPEKVAPQGAKDPDPTTHPTAAADPQPQQNDEPAGDDEAADDANGAAKGQHGAQKKRGTPKTTVPGTAGTTRPKPAGTDKSRSAHALGEDGKRALMQGDLGKAEELLTKCVKLSPIPECYRNLGILYGTTRDTQKSIENYQTYVRLQPNGPDVPKIKQWIEEANNKK